MNKSLRGFTIVELLIVIVVIAILASISIVAYNGVQRRSQLASSYTVISQYQKLLKIVASDGGLPSGNACLGPASFYGSGCQISGQSGTSNTALNNSLAALGMTNPPLLPLDGNKVIVLARNYYVGEYVILYTMPGMSVTCGVQPVLSQNASNTWGYWGDKFTGTYTDFGGYTLCAVGAL